MDVQKGKQADVPTLLGSELNQLAQALEQMRIKLEDGREADVLLQHSSLDMDGNEDKLSVKIAALEGCIAVYSQAVGASAI